MGVEYFTSEEQELEIIRQEVGTLFLRLLPAVLLLVFRVIRQFPDFRFHLDQFLCNQFGSLLGVQLAIYIRDILTFGSGFARHGIDADVNVGDMIKE
jgi:hypothetical protein